MEIILVLGLIIILFIWAISINKTVDNNSSKKSLEKIESSIPQNILEREYDDLLSKFINGELSKKFNTNLMLKKNEKLIFDVPEVSLCEERSIKIKGRNQGFSIRIMKGVSYRFGGFEAGMEKKVIELDKGNLILTNKRLVFSGKTNSKDILLSKINTITPLDHGIQLNRSGKQKTEYYVGTDVLEIEMTLIPTKEENFNDKIKWKLTGFEIKKMIQMLLRE